MLLERIYDHDLSQASYFVGCQASGTALVIDPRRDVRVYRDLAAANGMRIVAVTETHIHADYLSGTRELARATGAETYLSGEGGEDWTYGFEGTRLRDGDVVRIGNLTLTAIHTPGHTPEHLSFLLTDGAFASEPGYMFTGDFVFAGDLGRPDLLDEVAGGQNTRYLGAGQLFRSLREKFVTLPDYVQVFPAHGAGSPCGKALGSVPSSTVGYERRFAWWGEYLKNDDEQGFIDELLDGQPDAHAYFSRMKRENRDGPAILGDRPAPVEYDAGAVRRGLGQGELVLVDTRSVDQVHEGTVRGALNIPLSPSPAVHAAWSIDPAADSRDIVVMVPGPEEAQVMADHLVRVGVDRVVGYVTDGEGLPIWKPETVRAEDLSGFDHDLLLDVRSASEFAAGTIPGAHQLNAGRVLWHRDELPTDGTIVSFCQSGLRNSVAANALRDAGYRVVELEGSYNAWEALRAESASGR
ncbi:MBL fold metallo-hydrolase [Curtobacterium sp. S6]|uniref:MBL fold metallo-hydrolase n=1 Tax=Curtobacterium sp. S6 TaxID=1479623 RepID=UPI0004AA910E|nr:MBL fold metallo-hydrolase [Curtobacterium sp. S6]